MEKISFNFLKFFQSIDNLNPRNSGILFSILFHLTILLFAVGLPNFFGPKDIYVPNIIPIEILNVSENTNFEKSDSKNTVKKVSFQHIESDSEKEKIEYRTTHATMSQLA